MTAALSLRPQRRCASTRGDPGYGRYPGFSRVDPFRLDDGGSAGPIGLSYNESIVEIESCNKILAGALKLVPMMSARGGMSPSKLLLKSTILTARKRVTV